MHHSLNRFRLRPLLALTLAALPWAAQATNGYFAHGYGVKAQAVAGVGIALPQDSLTIATNPAGLAAVGSRLDAGINYFAPSRSADISGNDLSGFGSTTLNGHHDGNGKKHFLIPELGYSRQINDQITVGLAIYGNGGMNTQYDKNPFAPLGAQGPAGVNLEQLFISPAVSYKVAPGQVLGAAINVAHQRFAATGISPFGQASIASGSLSDRGTDTTNGVGVRLGWIGQFAPGLSVGATWASKIDGRFEKYKGLFADGGEFDIPANYGVGIAYQPNSAWELAADYQVIEYSGVAAVSNPLSRLASGKLLGSNDGPGFGWDDVSVYKFGVIHHLNPNVTLRAGYSHATQAVPRNQTFFNILAPGVVQDHVTVGGTWKADAHGEWSAFYGRAFKKTVQGDNAIPSNFGGGNANISLKEDLVGVSYGWKF